MLVLTRRPDQTILIGPAIVITVLGVRGQRVELGIEAPAAVLILRGELAKTQQAAAG